MRELARSTVDALSARQARPSPLQQRGPRPIRTDGQLLARLRQVLAASPFLGEGDRQVGARLRAAQVRRSRARVRRLRREAHLLAPPRVGRARGPKAPAGTSIPARPDALWGPEATSPLPAEGTATSFGAVEPLTAECGGIHAARRGTRGEARAPRRQGLRTPGGGYRAGAATGLALRHAHGSRFTSAAYRGELRFLGIPSSPASGREPEGHGCVERFIRPLQEQLLWVETFAPVEELRRALLAFQERYTRAWLLQRPGHRSPAAVRAAFALPAAA